MSMVEGLGKYVPILNLGCKVVIIKKQRTYSGF